MRLLLNLVYKDLKKNSVITLALAVFLIISTLFMAGGLRVTGTIISSMKGLNELAIPPQYLQNSAMGVLMPHRLLFLSHFSKPRNPGHRLCGTQNFLV